MFFRLALLIVLLSGLRSYAQDYQQEIDSLKGLLTSSKDLESARIEHRIATRYFKLNELQQSFDYGQKAYTVFKEAGVDSLFQLSANLLGIVCVYQNRIRDAQTYLNEANIAAQRVGDSAMITGTYSLQSNIYNQILNHPDTAFMYIDSAEMYYQKTQIKERIFGKIVKGSIFVNVEAYNLALKEYYSALDMVGTDSSKASSLYTNIGAVFKKVGDYAEAERNFKQAIVYARDNALQLGTVYYDLALMHQTKGHLDSALVYLDKAQTFFKVRSTQKESFQADITAVEMYFKDHQKDKAYQLFQSIDTSGLIAEQNLQLILLGLRIDHPNYPHTLLDKQFLANKEACSQTIQIDISNLLYERYKDDGQTEKALFYKEMYADIKDSILAKETIVKVQRMALNRVVRQKDMAIQEQEKKTLKAKHDQALAEEKKSKWRYFSVLSIALSLIIIAFIFFLYRNKRNKTLRQEKELATEKYRRSLLLAKLNEAQNSIREQQEEIEKLEGDQQTKLDSVETLMNNLDQRNWPNFLTEFELVYPHFFQKLDEHSNATLSKNERRLCALIKLNLSNKEIAEYVFVSPESVKKAKNRLFKKLNLDANKLNVSAKIREL